MSTSGAARYIGNPLFEASVTTVPTSTQTTSQQPPSGVSNTDRNSQRNPSYFQDISSTTTAAAVEAAASRRQAFSFGYSETESRLRSRPNLFSLESPLESSSRYLEVPNSYSTDSASGATRYSLDSLGSRETNKLSFRHHSVDSPEHVRRSQFR